MSIIVDGYNYIGRSREFQLQDPTSRDKLIYLMGHYCRKTKKTVTIVYDGNYFVDLANRKRQYGHVTVIYTSPLYTADDQIKKMVRQQEPKRRKAVLVVTSDADIGQYVQSHGASVVRAEDFEIMVQQALAAAPEIERTDVQISSEEVERWLKVFEEKPATHEKPKRTKPLPPLLKAANKPDPGLQDGQASQRQPVQREWGQREPPQERPSHAKKRAHMMRAETQREEEQESNDRANMHLSPEDVEQWLTLFRAKRKH